MIRLEGVEPFAVPPDELAPKLSDAGVLAGCLPDTTVSEATPDRAAWKVRPKVAFLSGDLDTVAVVLARVPGESVTYRLVSKGVGSASTVEATLAFGPNGAGGTAVTWSAAVTEMSGLLKLAPQGLFQATAKKVIGDAWAAIRGKLGG